MRIAKEALPFAVPPALLAAAGGWLVHPAAALPFVALLGFTLWFFRDPERSTPDDPHTLFSPADGKIIKAGPDTISIFMNVFDVHVCRAPARGRVEKVEHVPGRFLAAFNDAASEQNERLVIVLADGARRVRFTLVAGLIARRIVAKIAVDQPLYAGQRIGLIRFGSRVDVNLPGDAEIVVTLGRRVVAGETALARLPAPLPAGAGSSEPGPAGG